MNENHMKKAGQGFNRGMNNAREEAATGDVLDSVGAAITGTATAATELAKSAADRVTNVVNKIRD